MTDALNDQTNVATDEGKQAPFALTIPVRIVNAALVQGMEAVDVTAAGGLQAGGQPIAAIELKVRTADQQLVGALALGRGFELVLREIATPGPG